MSKVSRVSNPKYLKWLSSLSKKELKDIDKVISELPYDDHKWRDIPYLKVYVHFQMGLRCPRCGSRIYFDEKDYNLLSCNELTMDDALS